MYQPWRTNPGDAGWMDLTYVARPTTPARTRSSWSGSRCSASPTTSARWPTASAAALPGLAHRHHPPPQRRPPLTLAPRINAPMQVMVGEDDPIYTPADRAALAEALGERLIVYPH